MKSFTKYLLVSVLAVCCVFFGLTACGENEQKTYTEGLFALTNYDLYKDGQIAGDDAINNNNAGDTSQYFIELDNDGNMQIVFIELSVSTGESAGKYNLSKSAEKNYTYYINSSNKIVVKDGNITISYDMTINESKTIITLKGEMQTGNAQVISKFEKAD